MTSSSSIDIRSLRQLVRLVETHLEPHLSPVTDLVLFITLHIDFWNVRVNNSCTDTRAGRLHLLVKQLLVLPKPQLSHNIRNLYQQYNIDISRLD